MTDDDEVRSMTADAETERDAPAVVGMVVGARSANSIEQSLRAMECDQCALVGLPEVFIDSETRELEKPANPTHTDPFAQFFDGRVPSVGEAVELRAELHGMVAARFADHIRIAHNLGPRATEQEYFAACARERIEPMRGLLS